MEREIQDLSFTITSGRKKLEMLFDKYQNA